MHTLLLAGVVTDGANLYVSRELGSDKSPYDLHTPCKTILRAVPWQCLESTFTWIGPIPAKILTSAMQGSHIQELYKSLTFKRCIPIPQIRCLNWTNFGG